MNPVYILSTGIYSCLATSTAELRTALAENRIATPDAVPVVSPVELYRAGIQRNLVTRLSQAERYAFMATSQAMSAVFTPTDPDSRTITDPLWDTHQVRLGIIVASDASTLPHAEALSSVPPNLEGPTSPSVSGAPSPLPSRLALQCMTSSVSSFLAPLVGAHAFAFTVGAACASSHLALRTAALYLDASLADMILVVGVSETGDTAHIAFNSLGIDGVHPSGGAAAVLLASSEGMNRHYYKSSKDFGIPQNHPRITGFGLSQSPNRVTPDVPAMTTAMNTAIRAAYYSPFDIDLILAHHTGSQLGNASEDAAIAELYTGSYRPLVLSTKRLHGHEMWMSGLSQLVEAVALFALNDTQGLHNYRILCNSFAFGGTYSAFIVES